MIARGVALHPGSDGVVGSLFHVGRQEHSCPQVPLDAVRNHIGVERPADTDAHAIEVVPQVVIARALCEPVVLHEASGNYGSGRDCGRAVFHDDARSIVSTGRGEDADAVVCPRNHETAGVELGQAGGDQRGALGAVGDRHPCVAVAREPPLPDLDVLPVPHMDAATAGVRRRDVEGSESVAGHAVAVVDDRNRMIDVVSDRQVFDSDAIGSNREPCGRLVDPIDEDGIAVTPANDDVRRHNVDLFEIHARVDKDEVTGLCGVDGFLNGGEVHGYPNRVDIGRWQGGDWRLDNLAIGCGAVKDRRPADLIAVARGARRERKDEGHSGNEKASEMHRARF